MGASAACRPCLAGLRKTTGQQGRGSCRSSRVDTARNSIPLNSTSTLHRGKSSQFERAADIGE
eukprot:3068867-Amphidinium_carterae.1